MYSLQMLMRLIKDCCSSRVGKLSRKETTLSNCSFVTQLFNPRIKNIKGTVDRNSCVYYIFNLLNALVNLRGILLKTHNLKLSIFREKIKNIIIIWAYNDLKGPKAVDWTMDISLFEEAVS